MTDQQFTPGPWKALDEEDGRNYTRVRGTRLGERFKIANVLFVPSHAAEVAEARANARLIATAPDLYEAIELIRALLTPYDGQPSHAGDAYKIADGALASGIETRSAIDSEAGVARKGESPTAASGDAQ